MRSRNFNLDLLATVNPALVNEIELQPIDFDSLRRCCLKRMNYEDQNMDTK